MGKNCPKHVELILEINKLLLLYLLLLLYYFTYSIKLPAAYLYVSILNTTEAAVLANGTGPRIINDIPRKCVALCRRGGELHRSGSHIVIRLVHSKNLPSS